MSLLLTTNPGLEPFVASEILKQDGHARIVQCPYGFAGHVMVHTQPSRHYFSLRSIHHILFPIRRFSFGTLGDIIKEARQVTIDALCHARTFRVTSNRTGAHDFSSMDVQREVGAVLQERYGVAVDLEHYDVEVRADVYDDVCSICTQLTQESLSSRHKICYAPTAALKPNIAYAMLRLARPGRALLDPFCGSGTILLEAAEMYPEAQLYGSDVNEQAIQGTADNAAAEGRSIELHRVDARALNSVFSSGFDAIVTNPPYGLRLGRNLDFRRLYVRLLQQAHELLQPGGRLVLIVFKRKPFRRAMQYSHLKPVEEYSVEIGGIYPKIYLLEKKKI